ncbi:MAG: hypothetical protein R3300_21130 [Candidatus Promineifilaceae bacterium]|nr:hypothetical protein [Candidatus Promineifilaceae bacterium]
MNSTYAKITASDLRCQACSRRSAGEILRCHRRPADDCPFIERHREDPLALGAALLRGGAIALLIFVALRLALGLAEASQPVGISILLSAAVGMAIVYFVFLRGTVWLDNPSSHFWLEVTTRLNRVAGYSWTTYLEPIELSIDYASDLTYPPSFLVLLDKPVEESTSRAVGVFRAALIGLIASKQCQLFYYQTYQRLNRRWQGLHDNFRLCRQGNPAKRLTRARPLEARILTELPGNALNMEASPLNYAEQWQEEWLSEDVSMTVYDLVQATIIQKRTEPDKWLLKLVTRQTLSKHWRAPGQSSRYGLLYSDQYRQERATFQAFSRKFAEAYPALETTLNEEIRRAIRDMRTAPDEDLR